MRYKAKTPRVDKAKRRGIELIIRGHYRAAGLPSPKFLWAGNQYEAQMAWQSIYCAARYQNNSRYLENHPISKLLGLQVSKQTGIPVFQKLQGQAGPHSGQRRRNHRNNFQRSTLHIEKYNGALRQWSEPSPDWKPDPTRPAAQQAQPWVTRECKDVHPDVWTLNIIGSVVVVCLKPVDYTELAELAVPEIRNAHGQITQPHRPETRRFHRIDGPARVWEDGTEEYWVHGVDVSKTFVLHPERVKAKTILEEGNQERRRVMMEWFGRDRLLQDGDFEVVQKDEYGILHRSRQEHVVPARWGRPDRQTKEFMQFVEVINGTPEADGTRKHYFLQVPPTVKTAHEAVAWTYDMTPETYHPLART